MFDQLDALVVGRMNHLDPKTTKIPKDLDGHRRLSAQAQWMTVRRSSTDQSSRLCTTQ